MGSYKWSDKSPNIGWNYSYPTYNYLEALNPRPYRAFRGTLLITPLITTQEPPSRECYS